MVWWAVLRFRVAGVQWLGMRPCASFLMVWWAVLRFRDEELWRRVTVSNYFSPLSSNCHTCQVRPLLSSIKLCIRTVTTPKRFIRPLLSHLNLHKRTVALPTASSRPLLSLINFKRKTVATPKRFIKPLLSHLNLHKRTVALPRHPPDLYCPLSISSVRQ